MVMPWLSREDFTRESGEELTVHDDGLLYKFWKWGSVEEECSITDCDDTFMMIIIQSYLTKL